MFLILFYLSVSLQELNFEVKMYENYTRVEVLCELEKGAHLEVKFNEMEKILHMM